MKPLTDEESAEGMLAAYLYGFSLAARLRELYTTNRPSHPAGTYAFKEIQDDE